jgi:putative ABC transport system permease protein
MLRVTLKGLLARKLRLALTALAIVVGVTFVTGTLVLGDTLNRTFDALVGTVYRHVSFEIRGDAEFTDSGAGGVDSTTNRKPVPQSIIGSIRALPGVQFAYGSVSGYAQIVTPDGQAIGDAGRSLGFSFDPNRELSALQLAAGKAPTGAGEVAIDKATATRYHFRLGDRVRVLLAGPTRTFTITGIVTFGSDDNLIGSTLAAFYLPTAQQLFGSPGRYDTINVLAKPGADNVALQNAIQRVLPAGMQVLSGRQIVSQLSTSISQALGFLTTALLIFAFISLLVGGFTIFNTFSITVGQRTRELALLRVVGASRRQVFRSVLTEAAFTGLAASIVGLGLGVLAALGLRALLKAFSVTLPSAPLVFEARTAVVAITVGVGVTLLSAILPARRAVRIPPVAALTAHTDEQMTSSRKRRVGGVVLGVLGLLTTLSGVRRAHIGAVGIGAVLLFVSAVLLLPALAGPLSGAIGRPLAAMLGMPGRLGRQNSLRNQRRTAQTAAALMIGIALVSTITVLGSSLSKSATSSVDNAIRADYLITSGDVSNNAAQIARDLAGVRTTTRIYQGQFAIDGSVESLVAATPKDLPQTVTLTITAGRDVPALMAGQMLIDTSTARTDRLGVGSIVKVTFAATGSTTVRVGGIFKPNSLVGSYVVSDAFFRSHFEGALPDALLIRSSPRAGNLEAALKRALRAYPNLNIRTRQQFERSEQSQVNSLLGLVYVLLALAVVVALIGIVNTLMLSVFERTREIGLLRAVGMTRGQVKLMIRAESVVIALFGAVVGSVIGTALGAAMAGSLRYSGVTEVSVPVGRLIVFLVIAGLLGLGAAIWPARRAAKLDVLQAIATE